jgi:hypothetical protein
MPFGNIDFILDENGNLPGLITVEPDETENPTKPPYNNVMSGNPFWIQPKSSNTISFTNPFFSHIRTRGKSRRGVSSQRSSS